MQTILLTGCNGGIGKSTTTKFLFEGYQVIGVDVSTTIQHKNFHFIQCDLTKDCSPLDIRNKIENIVPKLDAIYFLSGIFMIQSLIEGSEEDLRKIIEINFWSVYRLCRATYDLLNKNGKIVVFSSEVARYSPQPFNGYYALGKILVDKYSDVLRREFNYLGIKVIKVQSGAIKTKLLDGVNAQYEKMVENSTHYKSPLTSLKSLMDDEINKQVDPEVVAKLLIKIMKKKRTKILYKVKNSFKLRFLNALPEKLQDFIYIRVIK